MKLSIYVHKMANLRVCIWAGTKPHARQWLDRPVRYVWGFPGQPAVAAIEAQARF